MKPPSGAEGASVEVETGAAGTEAAAVRMGKVFVSSRCNTAIARARAPRASATTTGTDAPRSRLPANTAPLSCAIWLTLGASLGCRTSI
jgi:hypothetical protein